MKDKITNLVKAFKNARTQLKGVASKSSPQICAIGGLVLMTAGTVYAIMKSGDANDAVSEAKEELNKMDASDLEVTKKDQAKIVGKCALKVARTYALPAGLYLMGGGLILKGFKILNGRYIMASGAAMTLQQDYQNFFKNVAEEYGEEKANMLKYGLVKDTVEEKTVDENGNETVTKKEVLKKKDGSEKIGSTAVLFSKATVNPSTWVDWTKDVEYMEESEITQQMARFYREKSFRMGEDDLTRILQRDKVLESQDFCAFFGLEVVPPEAIGWGWCIDPRSKVQSDPYVSCGIFDTLKDYQGTWDFLNGREDSVWLQPNWVYIGDEVKRLGLPVHRAVQ